MKMLLLIALLLIAAANCYPQQFSNWNDAGAIGGQPIRFNSRTTTPRPPFVDAGSIGGQPIRFGSTTTTARPAVSTTPSARYLACFNRCQATSEYNPICGSDNVNYYNPGRFDCALRCGLAIQQRHLGVCATT